MLKPILLTFLLVATTSSFAETVPTVLPKVLNDSWYVLQSGSTPWGYLHEFIEERDGQIHYRSEMTKRERDMLYTEFVGAISTLDLTPVSFNINKTGQGATEVVNGVYVKDTTPSKKTKAGGTMKITVSGARSARMNRAMTSETILETFFPLWVRKNWSKLKPGSKHSVRLLSENPGNAAFLVQSSKFTVKGFEPAKKCLRLLVTFRRDTYDWCLNEDGGMVEMTVSGKIHVKRVASEKEARAFLKE